MVDHDTTREVLELAARDVPFCGACGESTTPVVHDSGALWLECASLREPKSALRRLFTLTSRHTRCEIVPAA